MNRKQALSKIRKAYENEELGFQKGAKECLYYCSMTDSHCAVGVLIGKNKKLMDDFGNITYPFADKKEESYMASAMEELNMNSWNGLSRFELSQLQRLHDSIIRFGGSDRKDRFKEYLYSL